MNSNETSELIKTAPEAIYLCISDDPNDFDEPFENNGEVTWCEHDAVDAAVKYIRADLVPTWKDKPDAEGTWVLFRPKSRISSDSVFVSQDQIDKGCLDNYGRWFGPIPEGD